MQGLSPVLVSTASPALSAAARRFASVLAWGSNAHGECGVEGAGAHNTLLVRPTIVIDLSPALLPGGARVEAVFAGARSSSAALLSDGTVMTWGDGAAGKLGVGSGGAFAAPSRVEALVSRASVRAVALGAAHSLFLDADGAAWACGENKEGQLGLGTPLEELSRQHRAAYESSAAVAAAVMLAQGRQAGAARFEHFLRAAAPSPPPPTTMSAAGGGGGGSGSGGASLSSPAAGASGRGAAGHVAHGWGSLGGGGWGSSAGSSRQRGGGGGGGWLSPGGGWSGGGGGGGGGGGDVMASGLWSSVDLTTWLGNAGMAPGCVATPARIVGRPAAALYGAGGSGSSSKKRQQQAVDADSGSSSSSSSSSGGELLGEGERLVSVSASKHFTLFASAAGHVYGAGADFNGALGSAGGATWQSAPTRVARPLGDALAAAGGAAAVAAGGCFGAALTAQGRVVVWGKLPVGGGRSGITSSRSSKSSSSSNDDDDDDAAAAAASPSAAAAAGAPPFAEVALPDGARATQIAAGQQHLLISDGQRVFAVGRWLDQAGAEAGTAPCAAPQLLLEVPSGVAQLRAGMHSSAAVARDGALWLWGRLCDEHVARRHQHQQHHTQHDHDQAAAAAAAAAARHARHADWTWAGFGGPAPALVPGIHGAVRDVALGGWHALALVD